VMMPQIQPACGGPGALDNAILSKIVTWVTTGISIGTGLGSLIGWLTGGLSETILGIVSPVGVIFGALGGAGAGVAIVFVPALDRISAKEGWKLCYAGVVTAIEESFNKALDFLAPYTAQHDRADVVIKPAYWQIVLRGLYVWCNIDTLHSPLIRSYFKSADVIGAAYGSMIGAVVGATGGFFLGLLAGAALGCAFPLLCLLAILLALLIALGTTLTGAFLGGNLGRAFAGVPSEPVGTPAGGLGLEDVSVGDYVTINANVALYSEDNNAAVAWWVERTTLHGRSSFGQGPGGGHPFYFKDPQEHLNPDRCELPS
jgi:hypothetical protein